MIKKIKNKKILKPEKWFIDRIGKTIECVVNRNICKCELCNAHIIEVADKLEAHLIFLSQYEIGNRFDDLK